MVGWHHWLDGNEFEQTPGDSEGLGGKSGTLQSMRLQRVGHHLATGQQISMRGKVYISQHSHYIHVIKLSKGTQDAL